MADDARQIVADYRTIGTDDITVTRREQIRVRTALYTGLLDADSSTTVTLSGLPVDAAIVGMTLMINDPASSTVWRSFDNAVGTSATSSFRLIHTVGATSRTVTIADVGTDLDSGTAAYRLLIFWVPRL